MKKLFFALALFIVASTGTYAQEKQKKKTEKAAVSQTATPKVKESTHTTAVVTKKDGTPDKRYKQNKKLKKDGTPDKRYKENKPATQR